MSGKGMGRPTVRKHRQKVGLFLTMPYNGENCGEKSKKIYFPTNVRKSRRGSRFPDMSKKLCLFLLSLIDYSATLEDISEHKTNCLVI